MLEACCRAPGASALAEDVEAADEDRPRSRSVVKKSSGDGKKSSADDGLFDERRIVRVHRNKVHSVAVSGSRIATASWDGTVKLYDLKLDQVVQTLGQPPFRWTSMAKRESGPPRERPVTMPGIYAVAFSHVDQDVLGCVSGRVDGGSVHVWNHETGKRILQLDGHNGDANSIDFHPTQNIMATGSDDCTAKVWDYQEGKDLRTLEDHEKEVYGAKFLGTSMEYSLATCSFDRFVRVFDMRDESLIRKMQDHSEDIVGVAFSDSKRLLASGGDDGLVVIYDVRNWKRLQVIDTRADLAGCGVKRIAFDESGSALAAGCSAGAVLVYDVDAQLRGDSRAQQIAKLEGHEDCVFDVAWGSEQFGRKSKRLLVSASHDMTARVWSEILR